MAKRGALFMKEGVKLKIQVQGSIASGGPEDRIDCLMVNRASAGFAADLSLLAQQTAPGDRDATGYSFTGTEQWRRPRLARG